jgi:type VI protein secretion system component VasK
MGLGDEYAGKYKSKRKNWLKPFLPVLGLLVLAIAGGVGYYVSAPLLALVQQYVPGIPNSQEMQILSGFVVFLVIVSAFALIYAAFQPRLPKGVSEADLDREKREKQKEAAAAKRRKMEMQAKMRQRNRSS